MEPLSIGLLADYPDFRPRSPWVTGDLQTVRNAFRGPGPRLAVDEYITVDIGPAGNLQVGLTGTLDKKDMGVLLVHGMGGCEDSAYMHFMGRGLADAGYLVARTNLRATGPSRASSKGPYHAGLYQDVAAILAALAGRCDRWCVIGFSLGGHMALRLACQTPVSDHLAGIMSVCAPLDLVNTADRIMEKRNAVYHRQIVRTMRAYAADWMDNSVLSNVKTVRQFDSAVVATAFGFDDSDHYYRSESVKPHLDKLAVPALVLHAADDPWIPVSDYRREWRSAAPLDVVIADGGGHVGFHQAGSRQPYYVDLGRRFVKALDAA